MKTYSLLAGTLLVSIFSSAQIINVKKAIGTAVTNQTNNTIYNDVNNGVNSVFTAPGKIFRKVKQSKNNNNNSNSVPVNTSSTAAVLNNPQDSNSAGIITKSASSDFVPGTLTVFADNFSSTAVGEFPSGWITNSSGEVRTIEGNPNRWLQFSTNGIFAPVQLASLPDNCTIEFDAVFHATPSEDAHYIFYLYSVKDKVSDFKETNYPGNAGIYFAFNTAAGEIDAENFEGGKAGIIDTHLVTDLLKSELANQVHVSIARQKSKLSLYINGAKVFSSPNALPANYDYSAIKFGSFFMAADDFMVISNLKVAAN